MWRYLAECNPNHQSLQTDSIYTIFWEMNNYMTSHCLPFLIRKHECVPRSMRISLCRQTHIPKSTKKKETEPACKLSNCLCTRKIVRTVLSKLRFVQENIAPDKHVVLRAQLLPALVCPLVPVLYVSGIEISRQLLNFWLNFQIIHPFILKSPTTKDMFTYIKHLRKLSVLNWSKHINSQ